MRPKIKTEKQQEIEEHSNTSQNLTFSEATLTQRRYCLRSSVKQEPKIESNEQGWQFSSSIPSVAASTSMENRVQPISVKQETESTTGEQESLIRRPLTYADIKGRRPIYRETARTSKMPQTPKTPKGSKTANTRRTSKTPQASKTSTAGTNSRAPLVPNSPDRVTSTTIATRPPASVSSSRNNVTSPSNTVRGSGRKRPHSGGIAEREDTAVNTVDGVTTPKRLRIALYRMDLSSPLTLLRKRKVTRFIFDQGVKHSVIQLGTDDAHAANATLEQGNENQIPLDQSSEDAMQITENGTVDQTDAMPAQVVAAQNNEYEPSVLFVKQNDSTIELNSEVTESSVEPDETTDDVGDSVPETSTGVCNMSLSGEFHFQITPTSAESSKPMSCIIA